MATKLFFEGGRIVACISDDPRHLLGQFLLFRGAITEADLREAMAVQDSTGRGLPDILVERGAISSVRLEAEVVVSEIYPEANVIVYAHVPGTGYVAMADNGGGIHSLKMSTAGAPPDMYVTHVIAVTLSNGFFISDFYPKIRIHQEPGWDVDEPADFDPTCTELEPSGW